VNSGYLLRHRSGQYLYQTADSRLDKTENCFLASKMSFIKANNVLNNCISPNEREEWVIEESHYDVPDMDSFEKDNLSEAFNWKDIAYSQQMLFKELFQYDQELRARMSVVDCEICDLQHYIEFFTLDAAKGYKAYRMLKDRLERRRHIKNEMVKVCTILSCNANDFSSGKVVKQINASYHRTYRPRILSELFDMGVAHVKNNADTKDNGIEN